MVLRTPVPISAGWEAQYPYLQTVYREARTLTEWNKNHEQCPGNHRRWHCATTPTRHGLVKTHGVECDLTHQQLTVYERV